MHLYSGLIFQQLQWEEGRVLGGGLHDVLCMEAYSIATRVDVRQMPGSGEPPVTPPRKRS